MRSGPRGITVVHKEYLMDIKPTDLFTVQKLQLNPGLSQTFPWLSQITDAYEQYRFKGLVFEYKSTAALFTPGAQTAALGTVIMACNYNANSPTFGSKREMENYVGANSTTPTSNMAMAVNVNNPITDLAYIRLGQPTEENFDLRLYDIGSFQIATVGNQIPTAPATPGSIGELWATYEVELFKPKYRTSGTKMDRYRISKLQTLCNYGIAPCTASRPFTTLPVVDSFTPGVPGGNGYFAIGTRILSVGLSNNLNDPTSKDDNYNAIQWPSSSLGKTYRVDMSCQTLNLATSLDGGNMDRLTAVAVGCTLASPASVYAPYIGTDCTTIPQPEYAYSIIIKCGTDSNVLPELRFRFTTPLPWSSMNNAAVDCFWDIFVTEVPLEGVSY